MDTVIDHNGRICALEQLCAQLLERLVKLEQTHQSQLDALHRAQQVAARLMAHERATGEDVQQVQGQDEELAAAEADAQEYWARRAAEN